MVGKKMVLNKSTVSESVAVLKEIFRKYMGCIVGLGEIYLEILKLKIEVRFNPI